MLNEEVKRIFEREVRRAGYVEMLGLPPGTSDEQIREAEEQKTLEIVEKLKSNPEFRRQVLQNQINYYGPGGSVVQAMNEADWLYNLARFWVYYYYQSGPSSWVQ